MSNTKSEVKSRFRRFYTYEGVEHSSLTSGEKYTMTEFAVAINISPATIQSRFKSRRLTTVVRDRDLFKVKVKAGR